MKELRDFSEVIRLLTRCLGLTSSGISMPLLTITLVRTTSFSIYEASKRFYGKILYHPLYKKPVHPHTQFHPFYVTTPPYEGFFNLNAEVAFLAGATSGGFITVLSCPFEFTKLATQIELLLRRKRNIQSNVPISNEPKTPLQMAKDIYFGRGFRGLYSGFSYHLGTLRPCGRAWGNGRSRCSGNRNLFWIV